MSRRGGRGGRKSSASKELSQRAASEAGIKESAATLESITRPELYPDFLWRSDVSGTWNEDDPYVPKAKRSHATSTVRLMNKRTELSQRFQSMYGHLHQNYDGSPGTVPPDQFILQSLSKTNQKLATDTRYFPADLIVEDKASTKSVKKKRSSAVVAKLEELESKERRSGRPKVPEDEEEEELEDIVEEEEDKEEEAMDLDYTKDYYDTSENEGDAEDEATF